MGTSNSFLNSTNGLVPIFCPNTFNATNIVARQNYIKLTVAITGASHCCSILITTNPSMQCQNDHSRKLPSCPSQKEANRYFISSALLLCCHAYLYSNKCWLIM